MSTILREVVDVRRQQGLQAAIQTIQQNKRRETAEAISKLIAAMEEKEHRLLRIRDVETAASAGTTMQVILYGNMLGF
jgi:CHASE3 domain sensor protein